MSSKFYKIFKHKKVIIGAIHFPPLLGYRGYPGLKVALNNALKDLKAFENGKVDGIIIENNYDIPHRTLVGPETVAAMTFLGAKIRSATNLPLGINVLWNDYKAALSIAKTLDLQFIRIPVFVDKIKTDYDIIEGKPKDVIKFRKLIKAEHIALFTDVHVKHSKLISKNDITDSAKLAIKNKSDAVIVTGKWTGDAPDINKLITVRKAVGDFPILVGSGANKNNANELLKYANGVVVSTSLKEGSAKENEVNRKTWHQRINKRKVLVLVNKKGAV
ncbi:MAG: BtpA/SgcQ family protein [Candidatus Nealsonbacteria bacterium]